MRINSAAQRIVPMPGEMHAWHYMRAACATHRAVDKTKYAHMAIYADDGN